MEDDIFWSGLWDAFLEGDIEAFSAIHRFSYPALYHYALKIQQDEALADDAIQELFIKLWTKKAHLKPVIHVKAYLLKALRNIILNELRNLKLRQLKVRFSKQPDIGYSVEDVLLKAEENRERSLLVTRILNTLSKRQREFIYLKYYEDLSYREIADVMNVNYQSVLNLAQRTIRYIRGHYSGK